jgi:septal ring factor EnvC (AmiA/AmiB activator)
MKLPRRHVSGKGSAMQYAFYPILAALLVVLLVLYRLYSAKQEKLEGTLETRMSRLRREMAAIEGDMRRMAQKTDAVSKELVSLRHGLTSVCNQVVGIRAHDANESIAAHQDAGIRTLEIVGMRMHDHPEAAPEPEDDLIPTLG